MRFGLQTYSPDEAPLGTYVATSDPSTRFMIDGHAHPLDEALERLGEHQGYVRLVAEAPGKLALLEYSTGEPRDG